MPEITAYADAFYPMTWLGPEGYPQQANGGRCYFTGILGMLRRRRRLSASRRAGDPQARHGVRR